MNTNAESDSYSIISMAKDLCPDLQITVQNLEHPTYDFVLNFYRHYQNAMKDIILRGIDLPELEDDELLKSEDDVVFNVLRFVNKYLRKLNEMGGTDLTIFITDLYAPTAIRTKLTFKVLLNIFLFYDRDIEQLHRICEQRIKQMQELEAKNVVVKEVELELAIAAERLANNEDKLKKFEKTKKEIDIQYSNMQTEKPDIDRHINKLKHELKMCLDIFQNKNTLLENIKSNIENLNGKIVSSDNYNSLEDLKINLTQKLQDIQSETKNIRMMFHNNLAVINCFNRNNVQMERLISLAEELQQCNNCFLQSSSMINNLQLNYQEIINEYKNISDSILKLNGRIKELNEQSKLLKSSGVLSKIEKDFGLVDKEIKAKEKLQATLASEKLKLEGEKSRLNQELISLKQNIKEDEEFYENIYKQKLTSENNLTHNFFQTLQIIGNYKKKG